MTKIKTVTILGSGTSTGIPMVGCYCAVCLSTDPRDRRLRSSILLTTNDNKKILIDTSPDLRQQCFAHKIEHLDAVIITHGHADHTHGIDELRPLTYIRSFKKLPILPLFCSKICAGILKQKFSYIFDSNYNNGLKILGGGIPLLSLCPIKLEKRKWTEVKICGLKINFFLCPHGHGQSMSFATSNFAYIVDCHQIPSSSVKLLKKKKLKMLMIDCLQKKVQNTHLTMQQSFDYIKEIRPKNALLFHMNHDLSHQFLEDQIKKNFLKRDTKVVPAEDNTIIKL